jgi:hypothetical protein
VYRRAVNKVTADLFEKYDGPEAYATVDRRNSPRISTR